MQRVARELTDQQDWTRGGVDSCERNEEDIADRHYRIGMVDQREESEGFTRCRVAR